MGIVRDQAQLVLCVLRVTSVSSRPPRVDRRCRFFPTELDAESPGRSLAHGRVAVERFQPSTLYRNGSDVPGRSTSRGSPARTRYFAGHNRSDRRQPEDVDDRPAQDGRSDRPRRQHRDHRPGSDRRSLRRSPRGARRRPVPGRRRAPPRPRPQGGRGLLCDRPADLSVVVGGAGRPRGRRHPRARARRGRGRALGGRDGSGERRHLPSRPSEAPAWTSARSRTSRGCRRPPRCCPFRSAGRRRACARGNFWTAWSRRP